MTDTDQESRMPIAERDPVCGMKANPASPHRYEFGGKEYRFCCGHCLEKFRADPEKYAEPEKHSIQTPKEHGAVAAVRPGTRPQYILGAGRNDTSPTRKRRSEHLPSLAQSG